ncbi:glycosyltransferase N-terminal domain-containing protein [Halobacteriovorax sp. HLS]|uniref:glycosyltransferase N-terminal domain-containing protein n=1 Tax=Halobacteriovorax sp. HLS TaxID=2234000 RepID=UPI0013E3FBA0|nr:glycosyltransferase N-terminal domain-containing protein [Halobacteriovorax sp. HLS]
MPKLRLRRDFERRNNELPSFKDISRQADACFHVSSEGELEQCMVLVQDLLENSKLVEIVFTSDSVERRCLRLNEQFENLRVYRLALLNFPFFKFSDWVTAKKLYMCRYDFFSELMLYGARRDVEFYLLSGSLKNKEEKSGHLSFSKFSLYDFIYAASTKDVALFNKLGIKNVVEFEFRILQISKRLDLANSTLESRSQLDNYISLLKNRDPSTCLILGSAWPNEMEVFKNEKFIKSIINSEIFVSVAPHGLSDEFINSIIESIHKFAPNLPYQILKKGEEIIPGRVIINPVPGVLLESFSLFSHCFIGGGHGRSIHSVLEPYLAGAMIYCGPRTHRSTEYDFINDLGSENIRLVQELPSLFDKLGEYDRKKELTKRAKIIDNHRKKYKELLDKLIC